MLICNFSMQNDQETGESDASQPILPPKRLLSTGRIRNTESRRMKNVVSRAQHALSSQKPLSRRKELRLPPFSVNDCKGKTMGAMNDVIRRMAQNRGLQTDDMCTRVAYEDYRSKSQRVRNTKTKLRSLASEFSDTLQRLNKAMAEMEEAKRMADIQRVRYYKSVYCTENMLETSQSDESESDNDQDVSFSSQLAN